MKIAVPEAWEERVEAGLEERGLADEVEVVTYGRGRTGPFDGVEAFFYAFPSSVRGKALAAAPDVKWVQTASAGVDSVIGKLPHRDLTLTESGVAFRTNIGEFIIALMMYGAKSLGRHAAMTRDREWGKAPHAELAGKTCGIIGLGPIGLGAAERAIALGMRVVGCRRSGEPIEKVADVVGPGDVNRVFRESDFLVLACPLTGETRRLVDAEALATMKPDAWIINIARGEVVDTEALLAALGAGEIGGACLDVTDPEPLPEEHPLWEAPNVLITSHSSGASDGLEGRVAVRLMNNLERYVAGEPLEGVVDLERGY